MPNEKREEVKTFEVRLMCDCGEEMHATGVGLMSTPPKYPHVCKACQAETHVRGKSYPHLVYEKTDG